MRAIAVLYTLLLAGCTYHVTYECVSPPNDAGVKEESDSGYPQVHLAWVPPAEDAGAPLDAGPDAAIQEAGPDGPTPPDADPAHDSCPRLDHGQPLKCASNNFQLWHDGGMWIGCSYQSPNCPSGWTCSGLNGNGYIETHVCP